MFVWVSGGGGFQRPCSEICVMLDSLVVVVVVVVVVAQGPLGP